jgi:hypothetical protein
LPFSHFWIFLIGAACYINWDSIKPLLVNRAWLWLGLYLLVSLCDAWFRGSPVLDFKRPDVWILIRVILLSAAVFSCAFTLPHLRHILRGHDLSYGVYLYHMPVVFVSLAFGFAGSLWLYPLVVGASLLLAAASWLLVERPSLQRKRHASDFLRGLGLSPSLRFLFPGRRAAAGLAAWVGGIGLASALFSHAQSHSVGGVQTAAPIYELVRSEDGANWTVFGRASAIRDGHRLRVNSDGSSYGFQLMTAEIPTKAGEDYLVRFSLEANPGKMGIGVSTGSGEWIKAASGVGKDEAFRFKAQSNRTRVIVYNSNAFPTETVGIISDLTVSPVRR